MNRKEPDGRQMSVTKEELLANYRHEIGNTYNRLTILELDYVVKTSKTSGTIYKDVMATCQCACGHTTDIKLYSVVHGITRSCGCLFRTQKGLTASPIYHDWLYKTRTHSPLCPEWADFQDYHDWAIAHGFEQDSAVHRIDKKLPFTPDNAVVVKRQPKTFRDGSVYCLTSPDGEEYIVPNLSDFCYEHGLNNIMMRRVIRESEEAFLSKARHSSHDGWTARRMPKKEPLPLYEDRFFYPFVPLF